MEIAPGYGTACDSSFTIYTMQNLAIFDTIIKHLNEEALCFMWLLPSAETDCDSQEHSSLLIDQVRSVEWFLSWQHGRFKESFSAVCFPCCLSRNIFIPLW